MLYDINKYKLISRHSFMLYCPTNLGARIGLYLYMAGILHWITVFQSHHQSYSVCVMKLHQYSWSWVVLLMCVTLCMCVSASASASYMHMVHDDSTVVFDEDMMMESEISKRMLAQTRHISYGAMARDRIPCNVRGRSYYNCNTRERANPYRRGCSKITHCARNNHWLTSWISSPFFLFLY